MNLLTGISSGKIYILSLIVKITSPDFRRYECFSGMFSGNIKSLNTFVTGSKILILP